MKRIQKNEIQLTIQWLWRCKGEVFIFFFSVGSEYVNLDKKWKKRQKDVKNIARKGKRVWVWGGVFVYVTINSRSDVRGVMLIMNDPLVST